MTPARHRLVGILLTYAAMAMCVGAAEPEKVSPSTDTFAGLRARICELVSSFGERLDAGHDWIYRGLRRWVEGLDTRFAGGGGAPILEPLSPLRLGVNSEYLHRQKGSTISLRPDREADLHLPSLEHRFRLFVSSTDLPESPGAPDGLCSAEMVL